MADNTYIIRVADNAIFKVFLPLENSSKNSIFNCVLILSLDHQTFLRTAKLLHVISIIINYIIISNSTKFLLNSQDITI